MPSSCYHPAGTSCRLPALHAHACPCCCPCTCQDLSTGTELIKPIPGMSGNFEWAADNVTLFYVVKDHMDRCAADRLQRASGHLVSFGDLWLCSTVI